MPYGFHFVFCGFIIAAALFNPVARAVEAVKPNIIYIMADDLGYGDLSCYGQKRFETPNIDSLAAQGMRFTQFYSGSTVCAPSRCSLMTGLHTGHATVRGNSSNLPDNPRGPVGLNVNDTTIAEVLRGQGYRTGLVGKWGIGEAGTEAVPTQKGFDFFYGFLNQRNAHNHYPPFLWRNETKELLEKNRPLEMSGQFAHDLMTNEALEFINRNANDPFFLYLAYTVPHAEMAAPEDSMQPFAEAFPETPYVKRGGSYGSQSKPKAAFAAMVTRLDRDVGRIMTLLKARGIDDNTLVIFTSDNGPHGEGGHDYQFFDSNGPLRGFKRDLYEGGIRVPFIAHWPEKIAPGSTSDQIGAFWDFFPTAAEIAGADVSQNIDGISILPTLLGEPEKQQQHKYLYWEFFERGGRQAIRVGDHKAIRYNVNDDPDSVLELYDLASDPGETLNIADTNSERVKKFDALLRKARSESDLFKFEHELGKD